MSARKDYMTLQKQYNTHCKFCKKYIPEDKQTSQRLYCSKLCCSRSVNQGRYGNKLQRPIRQVKPTQPSNQHEQTRKQFNQELINLVTKGKQ